MNNDYAKPLSEELTDPLDELSRSIDGADFGAQRENRRLAQPREMTGRPEQEDVSINAEPVTQEQLRARPEFIDSARTIYTGLANHNKALAEREPSRDGQPPMYPGNGGQGSPEPMKDPRLMSDEEIAEFGVNAAANFNWNMPRTFMDFNRLKQRPIAEARAFINMVDMYTESENTWKTTGKALRGLATDPSTYMGFTALAQGVLKGGSVPASMGFLRKMIIDAGKNTAVIGALEGGMFASTFVGMEESIRSKAEERDFDPTLPMMGGAAGAAFGGALGGIPQLLKVYRGFKSRPVPKGKQLMVISPQTFRNLPETINLDNLVDRFGLDPQQREALTAAVADSDAVDSLFTRGLESLNNRLDDAAQGANRALDSAATPDAPDMTVPGSVEAGALPELGLPGQGVGPDGTLQTPTLPTGGVNMDEAINTSELLKIPEVQEILKGGKPGGKGLVGDVPVVDFEIAPNPDDIEAQQAWDSLTRKDRTQITSDVADEYVPQVLEAIGTTGRIERQIGGFEGNTGASLRLIVDDPEKAVEAAHALGHTFAQKSMVVVSDVPSGKLEKRGVVTLHLPEGMPEADVAALYDRIYELEYDGKNWETGAAEKLKIADGHTTAHDQMSILNFTSLTDEAMGDIIDKHINGEYGISFEDMYVDFPQEKDYGYDNIGTQASTGQSPSQGNVSAIREKAIKSRSAQVEAAREAARIDAENASRVTGNSFTDSPGTAATYGEVAEHQIEARNPAMLPEVATVDEIADAMNLDQAASDELQAVAGVPDSRSNVIVSELMQNEQAQAILKRNGNDLVAYPENTPKIAQKLQNASKNDIGMFSQAEQSVIDLKIPAWKGKGGSIMADGSNEATGKEIWNKINSGPAKKEELEWLGLEDYLTKGDKKKFNKSDVLEYIDDHQVRIEEEVSFNTTEAGEGLDFYSDEISREIADDPEEWAYIVEDGIYGFEQRDIDEPMVDSFINSVTAKDMENSAHLRMQDQLDWVGKTDNEILKEKTDYIFDTMDEEFEEFADTYAREQYMENPIEIIELDTGDANPDLYIVGNDDMGYSLRRDSPNGSYNDVRSQQAGGGEMYSEAEARLQAQEYVREDDWVGAYGDEGRLELWEEHGTYGKDYENYRVVKQILPDSEDSFNGSHWEEENVVSHSLVTDRTLPIEQGGKGSKSFHIEESQSDWHNEGTRRGYQDPETRQKIAELRKSQDTTRAVINDMFETAFEKFYKKNDDGTRSERLLIIPHSEYELDKHGGVEVTKRELQQAMRGAANLLGPQNDRAMALSAFVTDNIGGDKNILSMQKVVERMNRLTDEISDLSEATPNAPFKDRAWIALNMKRSLIQAAEEGYEFLSWSDGTVVSERWNKNFNPQYDQRMPKIIKQLTGEKPVHLPFDPNKQAEFKVAVQEGRSLSMQTPGYWIIPVKPEVKSRVTGKGLPLFSTGALAATLFGGAAAPYKAEADSDTSSLDQQGTSMTYRVLDDNLLKFEKRAEGVDFTGGSKDFKHIKNDDGTISTHKMVHQELKDDKGKGTGKWVAYPLIIEVDGELVEQTPDEAHERAMSTGEKRDFDNERDAEDYATGGYKEK
jgi:hypothetical protein